MAFTSGTSNIKLIQITGVTVTDLTVVTPIDEIIFKGDALKDGVSLAESTNSSIRVASGKDRQVSEKVNVTFDVIEVSAASIVLLDDVNGRKVSLLIELDNGKELTIRGIINTNKTIKTNDLIVFSVALEAIGYNIDDITDYV